MAVEAIVIARRVADVTNIIDTKIGNVAVVESIAESTKNQAGVAVEVEVGPDLNHIIRHLTTIRDLDQGHLLTKRKGRSRNTDTDIVEIEKTTVEVAVGAEVTVEIWIKEKDEAQHHLLLHSTM